MKTVKKEKILEIKRFKASFNKLNNKVNLNSCLICRSDPGKNFVLKYKRNNELKGKLCISCSRKLL